LTTFPCSMLRALIFIVGRIVSNGQWHGNGIAIRNSPGQTNLFSDHVLCTFVIVAEL
jgi:hypothetical protein